MERNTHVRLVKGDGVLYKFIDIHSHILPGVDDGCADIGQSLTILKDMETHGVSDLFLTPHYCKRRDCVATPDEVKAAYDLLVSRSKEEGITIGLHLGTEMEYSQDGARYIREGRAYTLAGTKYILVEFPPYIKHVTILRMVKEILTLGLIPVIAHIERYPSVVKNFECVEELKSLGVLIQVNIRSLTYYSFRKRRFLKRIFSMRYVDFIAGDVHVCPIEKDEFEKCKRFIVKCTDEKYFEALVCTNAQKYLLRQGL